MGHMWTQAFWLLVTAATRGAAACGLVLAIVEPLSSGSFVNAGVAGVCALLARWMSRPAWYGPAALGVLALATVGASAPLLAVLWMAGLVVELVVRRFSRYAEEER